MRAHGLAVMTTPLHGVDHRFKSGWAHSLFLPENHLQISDKKISRSIEFRSQFHGLEHVWAPSGLIHQPSGVQVTRLLMFKSQIEWDSSPSRSEISSLELNQRGIGVGSWSAHFSLLFGLPTPSPFRICVSLARQPQEHPICSSRTFLSASVSHSLHIWCPPILSLL